MDLEIRFVNKRKRKKIIIPFTVTFFSIDFTSDSSRIKNQDYLIRNIEDNTYRWFTDLLRYARNILNYACHDRVHSNSLLHLRTSNSCNKFRSQCYIYTVYLHVGKDGTLRRRFVVMRSRVAAKRANTEAKEDFS